MKKIRIVAKELIIEQDIKNLLQAQKTAAEKGDAKGAIVLSKEIIRLANKFGQKIIEIGTEKNNQYAGAPPNECENMRNLERKGVI